MEEEMDKKEIENEIMNTNDDSVKDELSKEVVELDEEEEETKEDLDAVIEEDEDLADEYQGTLVVTVYLCSYTIVLVNTYILTFLSVDFADEMYDEAENGFDTEIDEMYDEVDTNMDLDEIEDEIDETEDHLDADKSGVVTDDDWTWDSITFEYDDDMFENEYWNYDWDYGCGDLFETEIEGQVHDPPIPAGPDDSWPFINIYGSCKYCDAYVLDYFAEEAFEKLDDYVMQGIMFMGLGFSGILISFVGFIKYKLDPPPENQMSFLEGESPGVIAF